MRRLLIWLGWIKPRLHDLPRLEPLTPNPIWSTWWYQMCTNVVNAGLPIAAFQYDQLRWYTAPELPVWFMDACQPLNGIRYDPRTVFAGVYIYADHAIVLTRSTLAHPDLKTILKHEMTHALTPPDVPLHDPRYFNAAFGNYTGPQPEQL